MLNGSKLYLDFFEFLPPGGFVLTTLWFSMVGTSILSVRILAILAIVGIACFTFLACRQASRNAALSALLVVGWVIMSQGFWTQISHHWFTTLFSIVVTWATLSRPEPPPRPLRWALVAGLSAGAASMITPTRGALIALAGLTAFVRLRRPAEALAYVCAVALVPIGLIAYLVANHSLAAAFDDIISFTASRYAGIQSVPFASFASVQNFPLTFLFPLVAVLAVLICALDHRAILRDRPLRLCASFSLGGFMGCYPRPDIAHIAFAAPLALPLLALCVSRLTLSWHRLIRSMFAAVVAGLLIPSFLSFVALARDSLRGEIVPTPRGDAIFVEAPGIRHLLARIGATSPHEAFFFYPYMQMLPFLAEREQVSKYDLFIPGYTLPSQYRDACLAVLERADWVVVDRLWMDPKTWKLAFPAMRDPRPLETAEFERALDDGFVLVSRDETFELRRRRNGASDALCAGLADSD